MREHSRMNSKLQVLNHPQGQNAMSSCPVGCTCVVCSGSSSHNTRSNAPKICDSCEADHHEYCDDGGCKCPHPSYKDEMEEY